MPAGPTLPPSPTKQRRLKDAWATWEASTLQDWEPPGADGAVRQFRRLGRARAWVDWMAVGGPQLIRIESYTPPHGGRLLRLVTRICDEFGISIRAIAAPYNPVSERLPPPRKLPHLLSWYSKHGFEVLADNAVFYDGLRRYRRRRAAAAAAPGPGARR